jgi:hypothetical protein
MDVEASDIKHDEVLTHFLGLHPSAPLPHYIYMCDMHTLFRQYGLNGRAIGRPLAKDSVPGWSRVAEYTEFCFLCGMEGACLAPGESSLGATRTEGEKPSILEYVLDLSLALRSVVGPPVVKRRQIRRRGAAAGQLTPLTSRTIIHLKRKRKKLPACPDESNNYMLLHLFIPESCKSRAIY